MPPHGGEELLADPLRAHLPETVGDHAQRTGPGERLQTQTLRVRRPGQLAAEPAVQRPRGGVVGQDEKDPGLPEPPDQVEQELQGRDVGVAQIVHTEHQRDVRGQVEQRDGEFVAGADHRGIRGIGRVPVAETAGRESVQQRSHPVRRSVGPDRTAEELIDHAERQRTLSGGAAGAQEAGPGSCRVRREGTQQFGLAAA